jgi:hypothetical protein
VCAAASTYIITAKTLWHEISFFTSLRDILPLFHHLSIDTTMATALLLSALLFSERGVAFPGSPYDQTLLSDGKWDFDVSTFP